ncbi:threonine synthase [compost metagenome]
MVTLATAHPAKFPAAVEAASGVAPALPAWLADLHSREERLSVLANDQTAVEDFISARTRAA